MFLEFEKFRAVVVTGCQRSGTTIATVMMAQDLKFEPVLEEQFGVHNRAAWQTLIASQSRIVVQCPAMSAYVSDLAHMDDVAVVWMHRAKADIERSMFRVGWVHHGEQVRELKKYGYSQGDLVAIKSRVWNADKQKLPNAFDLHYNDLKTHPLWIPAHERTQFTARQITR